jgi:hypothetical protein
MFFVMAVFVNQDKDSSTVDLAEALDFLQIGILFFLIYFGGYYLPATRLSYKDALGRELLVLVTQTMGIFLLIAVQWKRSSSTPQARRLFGGLSLYVLFYGMLATLATWQQVLHGLPTGTWYDLNWSVPLLCAAIWAANWEPISQERDRKSTNNRTLGDSDQQRDVLFRADGDFDSGGTARPGPEGFPFRPAGNFLFLLCRAHWVDAATPATR